MTEPRPSGPAFVSSQLLVDLVTNTLDPGYAAAAARRGPSPGTRWDRIAVAAGCLLIGFTLVVAYVHTNRGAPEAQKVHDSLVNRVRSAQKQDATLSRRVQQISDELNAVRDRALANSGGLAADIEQARIAAGQVAVTGPGVEVTLTEPPRATATDQPGRGGTVPITATNILGDRDVRSVVNELWADGAEAVSVNDVRLTPTSAIRFAGEAVLIDFQPITSPYRIKAVGNAEELVTAFASSEVAGRYQTLSSAEGIGFSFSDSKRLSLPASAAVAPRYASVPATPSGSASSSAVSSAVSSGASSSAGGR